MPVADTRPVMRFSVIPGGRFTLGFTAGSTPRRGAEFNIRIQQIAVGRLDMAWSHPARNADALRKLQESRVRLKSG
jgi:hypothetical protein